MLFLQVVAVRLHAMTIARVPILRFMEILVTPRMIMIAAVTRLTAIVQIALEGILVRARRLHAMTIARVLILQFKEIRVNLLTITTVVAIRLMAPALDNFRRRSV